MSEVLERRRKYRNLEEEEAIKTAKILGRRKSIEATKVLEEESVETEKVLGRRRKHKNSKVIQKRKKLQKQQRYLEEEKYRNSNSTWKKKKVWKLQRYLEEEESTETAKLLERTC